jgi:hypothetical protein
MGLSIGKFVHVGTRILFICSKPRRLRTWGRTLGTGNQQDNPRRQEHGEHYAENTADSPEWSRSPIAIPPARRGTGPR